MKPSAIVGVAAYPYVQKLFADHLDMQFDDIRAILGLAKPDRGGCNFAVTALLTNLLGGFSVVMYRAPGLPPMTDRDALRKRFRGLVMDLFPRSRTDATREMLTEVLYVYTRNELAHALGLRHSDRPAPKITLRGRPLAESTVDDLERAEDRPDWLGPTVRRVAKGEYDLSVPALYWGTWRVLGKLVRTPAYMSELDREIRDGAWQP